MFDLFKSKPLLEPETCEWLFVHFAWSLQHFDAEYFLSDIQLVLPDNQHFPGRSDNVHGMANLIFDQVKRYAGMAHWPTDLIDFRTCAVPQVGQVVVNGRLLASPDEAVAANDGPRIQIPYNPEQVNNPEGLIASFAHALAHHLGQMAPAPPPGGPEAWPEVTELLAIYLGFGLMFANSAFTHQGGCGSCYNPAANRHASLSEKEATYALAIFAVLKDIPASKVTSHLKSHLRGFFKKAVKEVKARGEIVDFKQAQVGAISGA